MGDLAEMMGLEDETEAHFYFLSPKEGEMTKLEANLDDPSKFSAKRVIFWAKLVLQQGYILTAQAVHDSIYNTEEY